MWRLFHSISFFFFFLIYLYKFCLIPTALLLPVEKLKSRLFRQEMSSTISLTMFKKQNQTTIEDTLALNLRATERKTRKKHSREYVERV